MKKILIATHGAFAAGIKSSVDIIVGPQKNLDTFCAYLDGETTITERVKNYMEGCCEEDELIIVTDMFGGSVNNEFMKYISRPNIHLIAGLNLPLLLELILNQEDDTIQLIQNAMLNSNDFIVYCNTAINNKVKEEEF